MSDELGNSANLVSNIDQIYQTARRHQKHYYKWEIAGWITARILTSFKFIIYCVVVIFTGEIWFITKIKIDNVPNIVSSLIVIAFPFFFGAYSMNCHSP
jgi:hypothetical protein